MFFCCRQTNKSHLRTSMDGSCLHSVIKTTGGKLPVLLEYQRRYCKTCRGTVQVSYDGSNPLNPKVREVTHQKLVFYSKHRFLYPISGQIRSIRHSFAGCCWMVFNESIGVSCYRVFYLLKEEQGAALNTYLDEKYGNNKIVG